LEILNYERYECWKKASTAQIQKTGKVQDMWFYRDPSETPHRSQHNEQFGNKYSNSLREVSRVVPCKGEVEKSHKDEGVSLLQEKLCIQKSEREILQLELCESISMESQKIISRITNGVKNRTHRLKAIGNGQVPICMATAFQILSEGII
jgi:hypothetical protein